MITAERKLTKSEEDTLFAFGRNFFMRPTKKSAFKGARLDLKAANYLAFGRQEANPPPPPHRFLLKSPQAARPSARLQLGERRRPSGKTAVDNQRCPLNEDCVGNPATEKQKKIETHSALDSRDDCID